VPARTDALAFQLAHSAPGAAVDGDDHLDVIMADGFDSATPIWKNSGQNPPSFSQLGTLGTGSASGGTFSLAGGDMDGDGDMCERCRPCPLS
jgi:hypothetical protein